MPPGSERLSFRIAEIAAESEGGELVPLELDFARVEAREPSRERLLAFGILPAGTYTGLRIAVDSARLGEGPGARRAVAGVLGGGPVGQGRQLPDLAVAAVFEHEQAPDALRGR